MKLATLAISFVIICPVVAPPPLDVELRAKKEFYDQLKEDVLDVFGDNLIPDSIEDVIEDSNTEDPIEIKSDESSEFVPVSIPNKFDKYDSNDDDFIDEGELLAIIGVTENENSAFKAADDDGKVYLYFRLLRTKTLFNFKRRGVCFVFNKKVF